MCQMAHGFEKLWESPKHMEMIMIMESMALSGNTAKMFSNSDASLSGLLDDNLHILRFT